MHTYTYTRTRTHAHMHTCTHTHTLRARAMASEELDVLTPQNHGRQGSSIAAVDPYLKDTIVFGYLI